MNFIRKIFNGKADELVHLQLQRFGKGEFKDRALIKTKKSGNKYTISTSAEFANEFARLMAEKLGREKTRVTGAVISTNDLKGELEFKEIKQFQGVKRYMIDSEMSGNEILNLLDKLPKAFFALSFEFGDNKLKIKPKAPKSAKPKNKEETPKPDFCKIVTDDAEVAKDFVFEKPGFKSAEISHVFLINELVLPEGEKDFAKIREMAKRKGKMIRKAVIDGNVMKEEKEFVA